MLEALYGNQNIERILFFLFVNEKCYGAQIRQALGGSLTPIQKALLRLEKGGLIISHLEGRTRFYQFNPGFPLLTELEHLLKKAYTLLSAQEKKKYYVLKESSSTMNPKAKLQILLEFWEKLTSIKYLTVTTKSKLRKEQRWSDRGKGEVLVEKEGSNILIFKEKGKWENSIKGDIAFSNIFRWTFDRHTHSISLEHLRKGPDQPVFLLHLVPSNKRVLSSTDPHLCSEDAYLGHIHFDLHNIRLHWRVIGPNKNEEIDYYYS